MLNLSRNDVRSATFFMNARTSFWHFLSQNAPFQAKINNQKCLHQGWFSSSKYTKIRLRQGLCPGPHCGSLRLTPGPLADFQGRLAVGEERGGEGGEEKGGGDRRGGSISIPSHNMCYNNLTTVVSKLTSESLFPVIKSLGWEVQGGMGKLCKKVSLQWSSRMQNFRKVLFQDVICSN